MTNKKRDLANPVVLTLSLGDEQSKCFTLSNYKLMKKKWDLLLNFWQYQRSGFFLRMRISMVVLFVGIMQLSANAYSQTKVSLNMKDASIREVFSSLEKLTNYTFLYKLDIIGQCGKINVDATDKEFNQLLEDLLRPLGLSFTIDDQVIVITTSKTEEDIKEMITIKGRVFVKDSTGVPGASVILKGTSTGVITNMAGEFAIMIPNMKAPVLIFSFLGMKTREVRYVGQKEMLVLMEEDVKAIDEVIVTGYQRIRKADMVGSTNTVKREDLFYDGTNSIEQMLQGKLPGMLVLNTSGLVGQRQKVRVRGTSTLLGNQEPVWVVDGIIQEDPIPFKTRELDALGNISQDNFDMVKDFVGNAISWLNPNDIDDITVLKDASATVMYGVKAANGVIIITTKRGEAGRMAVNYSGGISVTPRFTYKKMNLMNSKERVDVSREIYQRGLTSNNRPLETIGYEGVLQRYLDKKISYDEFDREVKQLEENNTDWFDILFQDAVSNNHSLSISGGTDKISYYGSVNAKFTNGASKGNDSKGYDASVSFDAKLRENITVGFKLNGAVKETNAYFQVDPYNYATTMNRSIPCYNEDGSLFFYEKAANANKKLYNIVNELNTTGNTNTSRTLGLNVNFRWELIKGLQFESVFGYNTTSTVGETYADEQSYYITLKRGYEFGAYHPADMEYKKSQLPHGGELNTTEDRNTNYTWKNSISYNLVLAEKHRFSLMLGTECRSNEYEGYSTRVYGYFPGRGKTVALPPKLIMNSSGTGDTENDIYNSFSNIITDRKSNYLGFYASGTYGFGERYILTGSIRSDASNRFGQDTRNRFLPVWSVGARWNVHNEPWMQRQNIISDLDFRASYGWQGNVAENYGPDLIARIGKGNDLIDWRTGEFMLKIQSLPYENLRWEKTKTINLGTDFGLFQNKVTFTLEYYYKRTEDMIIQKEVPYAYGVTSMPINGGNMSNSGIEFSVGMTPIRTADFVWTLGLNTSKNFNKVESEITENENWRAATGGSINKKGYPVSAFWAFDFVGLDPESGYPLFDIPSKTENPEGLTDATTFMKYMGTREPDFSGGVSTSFRYKTLSLSASFNLNIGGKKFLYPMFSEDYANNSTPSAYSNLPHEMVNRWRKPGDEKITNIPTIPSREIPVVYTPAGVTEYRHRLYNYSDIRVVNASFLRCNGISLSYTIPERWVKQLRLKNMSLGASVSNPFIIVSKQYKGLDPEVASGAQPISRNYSFSINISL